MRFSSVWLGKKMIKDHRPIRLILPKGKTLRIFSETLETHLTVLSSQANTPTSSSHSGLIWISKKPMDSRNGSFLRSWRILNNSNASGVQKFRKMKLTQILKNSLQTCHLNSIPNMHFAM